VSRAGLAYCLVALVALGARGLHSAEPAAATAVVPPAELAALAPQVLAKGSEAHLPANLSRVLALSANGGPVPVRQAVQRQAGEVHVYNVLEPGRHAVVLLRVSEAKARTEAFLLDAQGALQRAVSYEGGGEAHDMPAAEAAAAFGREARMWLALATHGAR
jgi:hypothetical protein